MTNNPIDPDKYRKQTTNRLIIGGIALVFVVGVGLIYYFYGAGAAGLGTVCVIAGLIPLVAIIIILAIMQWIVNRNRLE